MSDNGGEKRLTVQEAGRLGGLKTSERHGQAHYQKIGRAGGKRVRKLIEEGKRAEAEGPS